MERGMVARGLGLAAVLFAAAGVLLHSMSPDAHALANCSTSTMAIDAAEQQIANDINARRADNGLSPLALSPNLSRAAAWKSEDAAANSIFSHMDSAQRSPFQRATDCGYPSANVSEVVAQGYGPSVVVGAWMGSDGHRAAILTPGMKVMGVGVAGGHSTVKFGFVDDSSDPWDAGTPPTQPTEPTQPTQPSASAPTNTAIPTATPTPTPQPTQAPQVAGIVRGMTAGVNLVSYAGFVQSPEIALRSLGERVLWVYGWDASRGQWLRYSPGRPDYVNSLQYMVPGEAYYIAVDAESTWSY